MRCLAALCDFVFGWGCAEGFVGGGVRTVFRGLWLWSSWEGGERRRNWLPIDGAETVLGAREWNGCDGTKGNDWMTAMRELSCNENGLKVWRFDKQLANGMSSCCGYGAFTASSIHPARSEGCTMDCLKITKITGFISQDSNVTNGSEYSSRLVHLAHFYGAELQTAESFIGLTPICREL